MPIRFHTGVRREMAARDAEHQGSDEITPFTGQRVWGLPAPVSSRRAPGSTDPSVDVGRCPSEDRPKAGSRPGNNRVAATRDRSRSVFSPACAQRPPDARASVPSPEDVDPSRSRVGRGLRTAPSSNNRRTWRHQRRAAECPPYQPLGDIPPHTITPPLPVCLASPGRRPGTGRGPFFPRPAGL